MKKLFIITILLLIFSFGLYKVADNIELFFPSVDKQVDEPIVLEPEKPLTQKQVNEKIVQEKIAKIKTRYAQRGLILAGDDHLGNNEYSQALKLYNTALSKSPKDEQLIEKVADTYFALQQYSLAHKRYKQLYGYDSFDFHKAWLSLTYYKPYTPENKQLFIDEIDSFNISNADRFYYTTMLLCLEDIHLCKKSFGEYIVLNIAGELDKIDSIAVAIENYEAFKVDELYYKDTLIIKALYDEQNYPFVISLGKNILETKPGYKPMLKMVAQSHFEMGEYEQAKQYLSSAYERDNDDATIAYMLGVVHMELGDYILSNIFLHKALENGYTPSLFVRRFLANNYIDLDLPDKALAIFSEIYSNETSGVTSDDLIIAIYYHILYDNIVTAKSMVAHALEKFPDTADFYGFAGWIAREDGDLVEAMQYLKQGYTINPDNAMITLNIAQVAIMEKSKKQAIVYLKQTIANDRDGQFGSIAQEILDDL